MIAMDWYPIERPEVYIESRWQRAGANSAPLTAGTSWEGFKVSGTCKSVHTHSEVECLTFDWLPQAIILGTDNYDVNLLADIVAQVDRELYGKRFALLSRAIDGLPVELLSPHVLATVLRAASPAKVAIPNWYTIVDDIRGRLTARGLDGNRILRGLI